MILYVFVPYRGFYFLNNSLSCMMIYDKPVFVPYRGFYFLNNIIVMSVQKIKILFSSPIGAFIFLILVLQSLYLCGLKRCFAV